MKKIDSFVKERFIQGIHGIVIPLVEKSPENGIVELYQSVDDLLQWIMENKDHLIRFENDASFSEAAGSGKLAVAIGLNGTQSLSKNIGAFRNISKLGLDVLSIGDPSDPIFSGNQLNMFGKEILQGCEHENVLIDWTIQDVDALSNTIKNYAGKVFIRLKIDQALHLDNQIVELVKRKMCF